MNVLFDVDDTLIRILYESERGVLVARGQEPVVPMIDLLGTLYYAGHAIYIASSGGKEYAAQQCRQLGINHLVTVVERFTSIPMDLSFDDAVVNYAEVNCQVRVKEEAFTH